jgi:hypothetical protein
MGGWGSGRTGRHGRRQRTNDFPQIDVRTLMKSGCIAEGRLASGSIRWSNGRSAVVECSSTQVELRYSVGSENFRYPILLSWTACNYGGNRPWFLCPNRTCGKRVAILYGGRYFLCRSCSHLAYPCQQEGSAERAARQAKKVRHRLDWEPGFLNFFEDRPKGMHATTYLRSTRDYLRHIERSAVAIRARIGGLADELGVDEAVDMATQAVQWAEGEFTRKRPARRRGDRRPAID